MIAVHLKTSPLQGQKRNGIQLVKGLVGLYSQAIIPFIARTEIYKNKSLTVKNQA